MSPQIEMLVKWEQRGCSFSANFSPFRRRWRRKACEITLEITG
jgi:hypothetical protein